MYENSRHEYLSAMGIDSYMPRLVLVNAAESIQCDWPELEALEGVEGNTTPVNLSEDSGIGINLEPSSNTAGSGFQGGETHHSATLEEKQQTAKAAQALLADFAADRKPDISPVLKDVVESKPALSAEPEPESVADEKPELVAAPAVRFSLTLWRCGSHVILDSRNTAKALPTDKLLLSMLIAIGLPLGNLPKPQVLNWPLELGDADESAEAARQMLAVFMETLIQEPTEHWVLMGRDAQYLLPVDTFEGSEAPQGFGEVLSPEALKNEHCFPSKSILVLPSLVDMLENSGLKAVAWRALKTAVKAPIEA